MVGCGVCAVSRIRQSLCLLLVCLYRFPVRRSLVSVVVRDGLGSGRTIPTIVELA